MASFVEFSGKSTEEALRQAQDHFALPLSRLEVDILTTGSGGLLGLFAQKARVRARPRAGDSMQEEVARILSAGQTAFSPAASEPAAPQRATEKQGLVLAEHAGPKKLEQSSAQEIQEIEEHAQEVVSRLCAPLAGDCRLRTHMDDQALVVTIDCPDPGAIIGRRAQVLNAIQDLAARMVSHRWGRSINLVLDVADYRLRRRQQLEETACKLANKVQASGKALSLGPLTTAERRIVHNALKASTLQTFSKGQGELKRVVIAPADAQR